MSANSEGRIQRSAHEALTAKDRRAREGRAFAILSRSGPVGRSRRHWRQRASLAARASSRPVVRICAADAACRRSRASPDSPPQSAVSAEERALRPRSPPRLFRRRGRAAAAEGSASASDPIADLLAGETHSDNSRSDSDRPNAPWPNLVTRSSRTGKRGPPPSKRCASLNALMACLPRPRSMSGLSSS